MFIFKGVISDALRQKKKETQDQDAQEEKEVEKR